MKKIGIVTPIGRAPAPAFNDSLKRTMHSCRKGWVLGDVSEVGSANTPRARNLLAQIAVDYGFDTLVWIDDDISWDVETFWALVDDPAPIVGVAPRARRDDLSQIEFCCYLYDEIEPSRWTGNIATAFLKTDVSALRELEPHTDWFNHPKAISDKNPEGIVRAWFDYDIGPNADPATRGYIGEDYFFCNLARQHGIEPVIRTDLGVYHWHMLPMGGKIDDHMK